MATSKNKGYYLPEMQDEFSSVFIPGVRKNFEMLDQETAPAPAPDPGSGGSTISGTVIEADNTGGTRVEGTIQTYLDAAKWGDTLILPPGRYWVEKNTSLTDFPNNDQPALLIRGKKRIRLVAYGATVFTKTHAQGVLELQACEDCIIEGLITEGYGSFPAIDTVSGYGEKGTSLGGYNTSGFWNYRKNNSYDTTARTNANGTAWGRFGGGFIGNIGSGVLVHRGCSRVLFRDCESFGFNYSGFQVGHLGDYSPTVLNYADSSDITFFNCNGHDNYSSNFVFSAVERPRVINCISDRAGHPNASKTHTYVDPGYGINSLGTNWSKATDLLVTGCTLRGNKRKAIDGHAGGGLIATDNFIKDSLVCGIYYTWTNVEQFAKDCIITGNKIMNVGYAKNPLGAIYIGGVQRDTKVNQEMNAIIKGNHVKKCFGTDGIIFVGSFDRAEVEGNVIQGTPDQLDTTNTTFRPFAIYFGYSIASQPNFAGVLANNIVDIDHGAVIGGILVRNVQEGTVTGNTVKMSNAAVTYGLRLWNCIDVGAVANTIKLGSSGTALDAETKGLVMGNTITGGNQSFTPLQGQSIAFRITANGGNGSILWKSGQNLVTSIVSNANGLEINLNNVAPGVTPMVKVSQAGSGGLLASTSLVDFIYIRQATHTAVILGLKVTPTSGHTQFSNVTGGGLDIEITI